MIRLRGARIRRAGRRHAPPHRGALGAGGGALRSIGAAVRLHPVGFGAPAAVIVAAVAYLVISGPVSVRFGHPGPSATHSQAAAQAPSFTDPSAAAQPGSGPGGQVRHPGLGAPGSGYAQTGGGRNGAAGTRGGHEQPSAVPSTPASASSPAPVAAGSSPTPAPSGSHSTCVDLGVVTVCV